ncbi:MAG TPA: GNAT family N-acetyltransferase [Candidatus Omnitrophota bacterium]|nr:GNAT family N-acetyltransferase [Candidatus Omnitrophota bacterium]
MRPLAASEIAAVAAQLAAMDPWLTLGFGAEALARYLGRDDPALRRMVLERDGLPAGLLALRAPWLRGPYVELLAVLPGHQGGGLGRAMVEWAAAQAAGAHNLWACVSSFNVAARDFYRKAGFTEVSPLPDLVADGFDEILLRRRLAAQ